MRLRRPEPSIRVFCFSVAILALCLSAASPAASGSCTPVMIKACGAADDYMTLWINGVQIGTDDAFRFSHVNCPTEGPLWGACPTPVCVTVSPGSYNLQPTGNVLAAKVEKARAVSVMVRRGEWVNYLVIRLGR